MEMTNFYESILLRILNKKLSKSGLIDETTEHMMDIEIKQNMPKKEC